MLIAIKTRYIEAYHQLCKVSSRNHDAIESVLLVDDLRSSRDEIKYRLGREAETERNNVSPVRVLCFPHYNTSEVFDLFEYKSWNIEGSKAAE